MLVVESLAAVSRRSVQHSSIGKHNPRREQFLVAVRMRAAAHAGRIVHHYSAHHATVHRCRIRPEISAVLRKNLVDLAAHESRLHRDSLFVRRQRILLPVFSCDYENRISDRLPRKACTSRSESHGNFHSVSLSQQSGHFLLIVRPHDNLRRQTIKPRISSPCKAFQGICINSVFRNESAYFLKKLGMSLVHIVYCYGSFRIGFKVNDFSRKIAI